ncbi:MAG: DNA polymerase III subunit alpha, partial [Bacteroidaceae bacterium]|nr:DNA polymerase III subunit alpha [Bacteroidaceae bacterium]
AVDEEGNIRFGLAAINGVGDSAVEQILVERDANGAFASIFDFVKRVPITAIKRSGLESLALSGAFDCFASEITREQFFATTLKGDVFVDVLTRFGNNYQLAVEESKNSLFGDMEVVDVPNPVIPEAEEWSLLERLDKERELVGIYLSAHPLDEYKVILDHVCNVSMNEFTQVRDELRTMYIGGIVVGFREGTTRQGDSKYGIAKVEDYTGIGEIPLFGEDYVKYAVFMKEGNSIFITRTVQPHRFIPNKTEAHIASVHLLSEVKDRLIQAIVIHLTPEQVTADCVETLHEIVQRYPGHVDLRFCITTLEGRELELFSNAFKVSATPQLISRIEEFGTLEVIPDLIDQPTPMPHAAGATK